MTDRRKAWRKAGMKHRLMFWVFFQVFPDGNMAWGNCWLYAKLKEMLEGGMVWRQHSHYGWWSHFLHLDCAGNVTEFTPLGEKIERLFPPLLFKGKVHVLCRLDLATEQPSEDPLPIDKDAVAFLLSNRIANKELLYNSKRRPGQFSR